MEHVKTKGILYIAFYVGKGKLFNKLIRAFQWLKRDKYFRATHTELVRSFDEKTGTRVCYSSSAMDGGVRVKNIKMNPENWVFIEVLVDTEFSDKWMRRNIGKKYDWRGIFSQVTGSKVHDKDKYYCNEAVQEMLGIEGKMRPSQLLEYLQNIR